LEHGELMPERENFRREFEPGADRGSKRGQQGDEQGSHPAREPYQALVRNRNGHNTYRIFSNDSQVLKGDLVVSAADRPDGPEEDDERRQHA
jgi:hypothetical protein